MKKSSVIILSLITLFAAAPGGAIEFFGVQPQGTPSILNYGWNGLTLGLFMGASVGYSSYDRSSNASDILTGAAYGSLVGVASGLILGFDDASKGRKGTGAIILRDMHLGGTLGLVVGSIFGGIRVANGNDWKQLGDGAAWGYLTGTIVGLGIALYEGPILLKNYSSDSRYRFAFLNDSRERPFPALLTTYQF